MEIYHNKDWLEKQYIILKKSMNQIAQECNVSYITINTWIHKFNIQTRTQAEGTKLAYEQGRVSHLWKKGNTNGFRKGRVPWNKGLKGIHFSSQTEWKKGDHHPHWKGENAGNSEKHHWVKKYKEKQLLCEWCKEEKKLYLSFDHSLGKHTRNIEDYIWLCVSCHKKRDWSSGNQNNQYTKLRKVI